MSSPSIQSGRNLRTQQQQQQEVLSDPSKYLVKSGDNLSKIAQQHGVDLQSLIAANPQIKNPDLIFPNQSINIPQAQAAEGHTPAEGATTGGHGETLHGDGFETGGHASTGGRGITEEGQQFRESVHTDPEARAQFDTLRQQAHLGGHTVRGNGATNTAGGEHGAHATDPHATGGNGHAVDGHGDDHHGSHTLRNNDGRTNDLNGGLHENGGTGHTAMRGHAGAGTGMMGQTGGTGTNRSASFSRGGGVVNRQTSRTETDFNRNTEFNTARANTRDNNRGVTTQQRDVSYRDSRGGVHSNFNRTRQLDSGYRTESFGGRSVENKTLGNGNQYRVTNGESQTTATNKDGSRSVTRENRERGAVLLNGQDNSAQQRMAQIDRKLEGFRGSSGRFKPENPTEQREIRNLQAERAQLQNQQRVKERNPTADAGEHNSHAHRGPHVDANANFAAIEKKTAWHGAVTAGSDPTMMKDKTGAAGEVHVLAARGQAGAAAGMNLKTGQLHAGAQAGVELDVIGASGRAQVGSANTAAGQGYVRGTANVGANASAGGAVTIDPRNLTAKVGVGGEAFAGAQVKGAVGYQNRYVGAEVEGRAQAGAGVAARAEVGFERGVFKAKADLGACLGVGGRVTVNINVNVGAMYQDSKAAVSNAVSSGWNTVKSWF